MAAVRLATFVPAGSVNEASCFGSAARIIPDARMHPSYVAPSRGKLSTEQVILTSAARAREIKTQQFGLPKFSPSQIGRKGKAQGQKAKGTEFEPRRSQNFLLKPLRPRAFSSRQEGEY